MKRTVILALVAGLIGLGLAVVLAPEPRSLAYWMRAGENKDWSAEARQGHAKAQFLFGLALIRPHLITMVDRVPLLSALPIVGHRFTRRTYDFDGKISQERLAEAYSWIKKSSDQGFAPAKEALKLFTGKIAQRAKALDP